ncbi:MAG: polyprenyl synthetase family protein [Planctomycetes bacterium]|nr:polyprenyl synthetase family protein [Planctomycetota bacterium]
MAEDNLELVPFPTELSRIYGPIEADMAALNRYLRDEFRSNEPFVGELLGHIAQFRGKQIRPACTFLALRAFGDDPLRRQPVSLDAVKCGGVIELIHTATLVHDDLLDDATIRRRVETVNRRWGDRAAVLLGDFIYSRGFSISTEVPGVSRILADTTHMICEGELLQVGSAFDVDLTEDRYYEIIRKKTAILYGMACRVGAMLAGASREDQMRMEEFGTSIGMAFQIADDALDLIGDEKIVGKSLGTDLKKGKLTLPIIRLRDQLLTAGGGKGQELLWLLEHPQEMGTQRRISKMLGDTDVLSEVQATATSFIESAIALLDGLGDNPIRASFEELARFVLSREL